MPDNKPVNKPIHKLSSHDRFTRSAMTNSTVAEEFFQQNLPEHIKKAIDFLSNFCTMRRWSAPLNIVMIQLFFPS